jgi:hypothetical protein
MALREYGSNDIFRLARVALEAAIRSHADLIDLLNEAKPPHRGNTLVATPAANGPAPAGSIETFW